MIENTSSARKYENEYEYEYSPEKAGGKGHVVDFGAYALPRRARERRMRRAVERYEALYTLLAIYPERASAVCLAVYFVLRIALFHSVAVGAYMGPLTALLPLAWGFALFSYIAAHSLRVPCAEDF